MKGFVALTCLCAAWGAAGCKSNEDKQIESAREQLALARERAAQAEAQLAKAELAQAKKELDKEGAELGAKGAELGAKGAELGAQGAALGMKAAAAGIEAVGAALSGAAAGGSSADLVDFRALKGLLPDAVGALKRASASGEKNAAMGFGASWAEGRYGSEDGAHMKVKIADFMGAGALAALGIAAVEVDKETETGFERTTTIDGNKAYEEYDNKAQKGELKVLVGKRFMIEIEGRRVPMQTMKDALAKIDLPKLQALRAPAK